MTYRYYLQDMAYAVAIEAPLNEAEAIACALRAPKWDVYLGRKNCVPTELVFQGMHADADDALAAGRALAEAKRRALAFAVRQGEHAGEVLTLNDVPLQFGADKRYRDRRVTVLQPDAADGG